MNKFKYFSILLMALFLGACGGGGDNSLTGDGDGGGTDPDAPVADSLALVKSSNTLPSSGLEPVTITAIVLDEFNGALPDVLVTFITDSGALSSSTVLTDANGRAEVTLSTAGDPANRTITVGAQAGTTGDSPVGDITVDVAGTEIVLTGPSALAIDDSAVYTLFLGDSNGQGLEGEEVTLNSENGNTISAPTTVTGAGGTLEFTLTADVDGDDTLTATSLGASTVKSVTVSADSFSIIEPDAGTEVILGDTINVTLSWVQGNAPVVGSTVEFSTTRGLFEDSGFSGTSVVTDGSGEATVTIASLNSGIAEITASDPDTGTSTSVLIEFVATEAVTLALQPDIFALSPDEQAQLEATVRDAAGNLVKNKTVDFTLDDVTSGTLSPGFAVTNSDGVALSFYTAAATPSAFDGVQVTATVRDTPAVSDSVGLTVGGQELFLSIVTGNELEELGTTLYGQEWSIIVTDAGGASVAGATVQASVLSNQYRKGEWVVADTGMGLEWVQDVAATCDDEDVNRNGILDDGEDFNGSGFIEAGNQATVVPIDPNAPFDAGCGAAGAGGGTSANVETNNLGIARVCLIYGQSNAYWVNVGLQGKLSVAGTEFSRTENFWLIGLASDYDDATKLVPGRESAFGQADSCANPE